MVDGHTGRGLQLHVARRGTQRASRQAGVCGNTYELKNEMADTGVYGLSYAVSAISLLPITILTWFGGGWQIGNENTVWGSAIVKLQRKWRSSLFLQKITSNFSPQFTIHTIHLCILCLISFVATSQVSLSPYLSGNHYCASRKPTTPLPLVSGSL